jgi:cytochrome c-type biogenesis protein CcmH/NrfF
MTADPRKPRSALVLWLWVILAFLILIGAWTTLITIAKRNQPQKIELEQPDR